MGHAADPGRLQPFIHSAVLDFKESIGKKIKGPHQSKSGLYSEVQRLAKGVIECPESRLGHHSDGHTYHSHGEDGREGALY